MEHLVPILEQARLEKTTDKERTKQLLAAADFTHQLMTPDGTMVFKKAK